jgi:hypothetical protein
MTTVLLTIRFKDRPNAVLYLDGTRALDTVNSMRVSRLLYAARDIWLFDGSIRWMCAWPK